MPHAPLPPPSLPEGRIFLTDTLGRTLILPRSWRLTADSQPATTPRLEGVRRAGAIQTGPRRLGVRTGGASGELHSVPGSDEQSVWAVAWPPEEGDWAFGPAAAQLDALKLIAQQVPLDLQLGSRDARILTLDALTITTTEVDALREQVTLSWEAFDPLWRGATEETSDAILAQGATHAVNVEGTAPTRPLLTLTGPIENPVVTNETTGDTFEYFGTLASGQDLVVDTSELTATVDGVSVLGSMSDSFALGFHLQPGDNFLRLESTSGGATLAVAWRERWY